MTQAPPPAPTVAVVGAGLAGLAAAWWLARSGWRVSVFERHAAPGFVAHSVALPAPTLAEGTASDAAGTAAQGTGVRIDVPIRVFYAGYYPTLVALYAQLGVASEAVSYASSFHDESGQLYFRYRNLRLGGRSYSWIAPSELMDPFSGRGTLAWADQRIGRGEATRRIVAAALRFGRLAPQALRSGTLAGLSMGEYLQRERFDDAFVHGLLVPAIATIGTCDVDDAMRFPAEVIVGYLARGLTREPVRRAVLGADEVVRRLGQGIVAAGGALRLAQAPVGLSRCRTGSAIWLHMGDGARHRFDHAVLATQANQAMALLGDANEQERHVLGSFSYRPVAVVMHRDAGLLPARRSEWSAVNLRVTPAQARPQSTIWVNAVQPALAAAPPVFQTVHPSVPPRDETVLSWAHFERPVVNASSAEALAALKRLHTEADRRVWFCGSYAQPGIPLLESAVRSAQVVVQALAARRPGTPSQTPSHEPSRALSPAPRSSSETG